MSEIMETAVRLPLLALRGLVVFPKTVASFDVARKKSSNALKAAMDRDQILFVTTQKDFYVEDPEENREVFRQLKKLSVDIAKKNINNIDMGVLSMGMTGDYMVAVQEGATLVRVGTGIFGERDYSR